MSLGSSDTKCRWKQTGPRLTASIISGKGTCVGVVPASHQNLCNTTQTFSSNHRYLPVPSEGWWACNSGLTPCVSLAVINQNASFCVLVQLVPRLIYHPEESFLEEYLTGYWKSKREPVSRTLAVLLGLGIATGIDIGTAALATQAPHYSQLRIAIDEDIQALENSV